jgi:hypothetical protein
MPTNLAGIQMLKEVHAVLISELSKKEVESGPMFVMSKDLHINEPEWPYTEAWLGTGEISHAA